MKPYHWTDYSNKLTEKILHPKNYGVFTEGDGVSHGMRLVIGEEKNLRFYLLIDESDGIIADAKYQVFGDPALVGAAEFATEIILRKNYVQARSISADMIDHRARDFGHIPAFPEVNAPHLNLIVSVIENAAEKCMDIPILNSYVSSPISIEDLTQEEYPGWEIISEEEKLVVIRRVIAEEIQPYIELDDGGVQVLRLLNQKEVIIAYEGACVSCPASVGATLHSIEQMLKSKIHPSITVTPDPSFLHFSSF